MCPPTCCASGGGSSTSPRGSASIIGQMCLGAMTFLYRFCYGAKYPSNFACTEFSVVGAREEGPGCSGPSPSQRFGLGALSDVARVVVNHSCARALIDHRSMHDARVLHRT